jgi:hypothetical protein
MSVACACFACHVVFVVGCRLASDGESGESQSGRTPRMSYSRSPERVEKAKASNQRKTPQNKKYVEQKQTPKINPVHLTSVQTTI